MKRCIIILSALVAMQISPAAAQEPRRMHALDRPVLELIGTIEAPRGYGTITGFARTHPSRPITQMTLSEVMAWQTRIRAQGAVSTAVGRYQFTRNTLREIISRFDVSADQLLNRRTQDYMARLLMYLCDFYDAQAEVTDVGNCLAGRWAALPMLSGPKKGRSRYQGVAGNHARTSVTIFRATLSTRFTPDPFRIAVAAAEGVRDEVDRVTSPSNAPAVSISQEAFVPGG